MSEHREYDYNWKGMAIEMKLLTVLETLCNAAGAGSQPDAPQKALAFLKEYIPDAKIDALGSVVGIYRCGVADAPVVLLEAHIDEVGFIVTGVDDKGFVRVSPCGGADRRTLAAAEVVVWGEKPFAGVFCSTPPHLCGEDDKLPEVPDMGIDVGLDEEEAKKRIPLGTRVTYRPNFMKMTEGRVCSKALDDRSGVASILYCLDLLKNQPLTCDVAVVFAVQEELGCRGSGVAAYAVNSSAAIAVDVSFAKTPDADAAKCGELGKGPMLGYAPTLDMAMTRCMEELAKTKSIPLQREVMGGETGTDADSISSSRAGVPTALLSIPLRYMHTPTEMAELRDIEQISR